jgi:hypothetical protein
MTGFLSPLTSFPRHLSSNPFQIPPRLVYSLPCLPPRPHLLPVLARLKFVLSVIGLTTTTTAATRTFRGREAARCIFFAMDPTSVHGQDLGGTYKRYKTGQAKFTAWLREAAARVTSKPTEGTDQTAPSSPERRSLR